MKCYRFTFQVALTYPTRPLDMEDDPESIRRRKAAPVKNRRRPQILQPGQHEPIYPREIWERNISIRNAKGNNPASIDRPRREYLLTGIARCWICFEHAGKQAGFRGSTSKGNQYYRCATLRDKAKRVNEDEILDVLTEQTGVVAEDNNQWEQLIKAHPTSTVHADALEGQVNELMNRFVIPADWYEMIAAYYLSDHGMADFERESYNLRQELSRFRDMYTSGYLTQAQFQERAMLITRELQSMQVTAKPEVQVISPLLADFKSIWSKATSVEQRGLLKKMFVALYFDAEVVLHQALANAPFDQLVL